MQSTNWNCLLRKCLCSFNYKLKRIYTLSTLYQDLSCLKRSKYLCVQNKLVTLSAHPKVLFQFISKQYSFNPSTRLLILSWRLKIELTFKYIKWCYASLVGSKIWLHIGQVIDTEVHFVGKKRDRLVSRPWILGVQGSYRQNIFFIVALSLINPKSAPTLWRVRMSFTVSNWTCY